MAFPSTSARHAVSASSTQNLASLPNPESPLTVPTQTRSPNPNARAPSTQSAPPHMLRNNGNNGKRELSGSPDPSGDTSLTEDPLALKRRQNTIAARRSRQRKLEHVRSLEKQVDNLTRERDELRSRVARLEDRVAFLKEIVAGGGGNSAVVATSPRAMSRSTRQLSGKRAATMQWDDHNDVDELYGGDTGGQVNDEEYDNDY